NPAPRACARARAPLPRPLSGSPRPSGRGRRRQRLRHGRRRGPRGPLRHGARPGRARLAHRRFHRRHRSPRPRRDAPGIRRDRSRRRPGAQPRLRSSGARRLERGRAPRPRPARRHRPPRLHRLLPLDRSRPPPLGRAPDEPHLPRARARRAHPRAPARLSRRALPGPRLTSRPMLSREPMGSRLLALLVLLACGCGGARPPPVDPPPLDDEEDGPRPTIAGIVLPPLPLDVEIDDRELEEGWRRASVALSMPTPRPPSGELWEVEAWADEELSGWMHRRAEAIGAAQRALESARM